MLLRVKPIRGSSLTLGNRYIWIAAVVTTAILIVVLALRSREDILLREAQRLAKCLSQKDVSCVSTFVLEGQRSAYGSAAPDDIVRWWSSTSDFSEPVILQPEESSSVTQARGSGYFKLTGSGATLTRAPFTFELAFTEHGVRAPALIDRLLLHRWAASVEPIAAGNRAEAALTRILHGLQGDKTSLLQIGLSKLHHRDGIKTLTEMEDYYLNSITEIRAKRQRAH